MPRTTTKKTKPGASFDCAAGQQIRARLEESVGVDRVRRVMGHEAFLRMEGDVLEVVVPDRITAELTDRCLGLELRDAVECYRATEIEAGRSVEPSFRGVRVRMAPVTSRSAGRSDAPRAGSGSAARPGAGRGATQGAGFDAAPDRSRAPSALARAPRSHPGSAGDTGAGSGLGSGLGSGRDTSYRGGPQAAPRANHIEDADLLDRFVVGASNRHAHAAAVRMAGGSMPRGSVLFLHGGYGIGKTHLLRGVTGAVRARGGRSRYVTSEAFTSAYVSAIREGGMAAFKRRFRAIDVLCIDDVHLLVGRSKTQQELVQTLDALQGFGARVVLASDAPPREIGAIEGALVSRFASGVTLQIGEPDAALIEALVRTRAAEVGLAMSAGGINAAMRSCLARGVRSVREVVGSVTQIGACVRLEGGKVADAALVERALELRQAGGDTGRPVGIRGVIDAACATTGVTHDEVFGKGRAKRAVLTREVIVHVAKALTGASYPEIAGALHRTNHSTVITQFKSFERRLGDDETVRASTRVDGLTVRVLAERVSATAKAAR